MWSDLVTTSPPLRMRFGYQLMDTGNRLYLPVIGLLQLDKASHMCLCGGGGGEVQMSWFHSAMFGPFDNILTIHFLQFPLIPL